MVKIELQQDTALLRGQIAALYQIFQEQENNISMERARDLAIKLEKEEYSIAFCGHFSAGKSSMINQIMGEKILPSSPIPTSANLVKIKSGDDYAKVYFKEDQPRLYRDPYDFEIVKSYCKDGDQIQSIEISYSKTSIPKDTIIMDTPGIDSTDDAHRIATESALHLADLIFYVMDYNHVQSELNFQFTKELTEAGKEIYLVINQIDKHREEELSFYDFQKGVKESFASWGVKPAHIFYTSLKKENHPYNQFQELRQFIEQKINNRRNKLPESIFQSLNKLADEHRNLIASRYEEDIQKNRKVLDGLSEEDKRKLPEIVEELTSRLEKFSQLLQQKEKQFYEEVDNILDNAYLMPFQTRDLAEQYLAARQSDFKVGLFFSKQKTEQEREQRLEKFYADLKEKVQSQLEWHIKELIIKSLKENEIQDDQLLIDLQKFSIHIEKDLLASIVKTGASLTGDYVLNYTKDVSDAIKRLVKEKIVPYKEAYFTNVKERTAKQSQKVEEKLKQYKVYLYAYQEIASIEERKMLINIQLDQILNGTFEKIKYLPLASQLAVPDEEDLVIIDFDSMVQEKMVKKKVKERSFQTKESNRQYDHSELETLIPNLKFTADQVMNIPGFKKISAELIQKAEKLANQSFTVALFGAFSAGKSSFANALLGEKLLPVSPNPTTAAINKIMPVTPDKPHGTVIVKLKSLETLMNDVNRSLAAFAKHAVGLDDAITSANDVVKNQNHEDIFEKTHLAFLQAFVRGINAYSSQLGEMIQTNIENFAGFVANEEQSCLVEWIEVYYECELTQKGITLVDTPGADSINARHTGVAFEYIKNSDAILFVTYYNHAFSKADREFLIQLGRVKDTFALDKMFFIVNAIDLAHDEEEMHAVLDYVEEQLVAYGIRQPDLYPISSLQALEEKLAKKPVNSSGIGVFEERFYSFIEHDLGDIAINAAKLELQRTIAQLKNFIHSAEADQDTKEKLRIKLYNEKESMLQSIKEKTDSILQQRLVQEIEELVFYIKQRVFLRFGDFIREAFNPALLKDDGRNLRKALQNALDSFLEDFGYDFAQELRATTLRTEAYIGKLFSETEDNMITELKEKNPLLTLGKYEMEKMNSIDFEIAFVSLDQQMCKKALSYFKNPKSFFEKNERKFLSDELEIVLQQPADEYLAEGKEKIGSHYSNQLNTLFNHMIMNITEQIEEYYQGALASISNEIPIDELKMIEEKLHFIQ